MSHFPPSEYHPLAHPLSHPQWRHIEEEELCYPGGESDSADEFLGSTPSPPLYMASLPADSVDYSVAMEYSISPHPSHFAFGHPSDMANRAHIAVSGGPPHLEGMSEHYELGRGGRGMGATRQRRIQEHHPYPRPPHDPSNLPAPHNDHPHLPADTRHRGARNGGVMYRHPAYTPSPPAPAHMALPPNTFHGGYNFPDAGDYLREQLKLPPNAPVNLWSVPDRTDGIKPGRMVTLMMLAIYGSDAKKLTLQGIIQALIARFWYYNEHQADMSWKNSIRHSLSLYKMFVKVKRPVYDQGKGSYWVLDVSSGETFTRSRKRRSKDTRQGSDDEKYHAPNASHCRPRIARWNDDASDKTSGSVSDFDQCIFDLAHHAGFYSPSPSTFSLPSTMSSRSGSVPRSETVGAQTRVSSRLRSSSSDALVGTVMARTEKVAMKGRRAPA